MKIIFLFLLIPSLGWGAAGSNSCIECHQKLKTSKFVEHNYTDWEKSIHAAVGIQCSECHGGNPGTSDPVKAHQGVLSSKDKNSSIHFQKIPETCGRCHTEEFQEFQKSAHYKNLLRTGKGPNCLTCHGAMATTVMAYTDMQETCSLCHGKPMQAAKALSLIHSVKNLLKVYHKQLLLLEKSAETEFDKRYQKIQREWHSFDVVTVVKHSEKLLEDIKKELEILKRGKGEK